MNRLFRLLPCAALALPLSMLSACSEKKPVEPPRPSVIDPQLKAIEAARGVEGTLKEQDAARRRMIDGAEKP